MKYLLIDTTTFFVTIAIASENKLLYIYHEQIKEDMSSKIIPIIESAFNQLDFDITAIDKILVANGPGSFTGIRVGVTIAKTIAYSLKKDIIPISSLELMATTSTNKKFLIPMIDARRGNVYSGVYDNELNIISPNKLVSLKEISNSFNNQYDFISYDDIKISNLKVPSIDVLKIINKHKFDHGINPHNLNPNYLKLTQAEEDKKSQ